MLTGFILKIFDFIVKSNIYISLAAVFLTIATQLQLGMKPYFEPYLLLIFFATFFDYNIHRLITILTHPASINEPKYFWVKDNRKIFYFLIIVSIIGFIISLLLIKKSIIISLLPIGIITLLYSLPVYKRKKIVFRLREIPFLKIFLIAAVWSLVTILIPYYTSENNIINIWHIVAMLIERFIFIFAITIPFDIRDMSEDKKVGLKTIPLIIGEKKSILLVNIYLFLFLIVSFFHYFKTSLSYILPAIILSTIITYIILNNNKLKAKPNYHYFILDGTILLQGILVCVSYYLKKL